VAGLDGRELGRIELLDKGGGFSDVDDATVLHVAHMAAASVERAQLYVRAQPSRPH
jgi:GAF domain-containing protein